MAAVNKDLEKIHFVTNEKTIATKLDSLLTSIKPEKKPLISGSLLIKKLM